MKSTIMWLSAILIIGCVCVFSSVTSVTSDRMCDLIDQETTILWIKDTKDKFQTFSVNITDFNLQGVLIDERNITTTYKQMEPIAVQAGLNVHVDFNHDLNHTKLGFLKTAFGSFINCDNASIMGLLIHVNTTELSISSDTLDNGVNYFHADDKETCDSGWRVKITVIETNECQNADTDITCSGNGHCALNDKQTAFTCTCCPGFYGKYCELEDSDEMSLCDGKVCKNGGTCVTVRSDSTKTGNRGLQNSTTELTATCLCTSLFSGQECEFRLDHCKSNPCIHGVCVEKIDGYQCYCIPGFHGQYCQLEYDECMCNPCHHRGTCVDRLDRYECHCSPGYTGPNCETKVDMCRKNPCHMNGTCVDLGNTFMCSCTQRYTGKYCEKRVNECASNPCENHGTCIDLENGFQCLCPITFAGVHCEYMMDVFAPPLEGSDLLGRSHAHNLYIVAGTLSGAIVVILVVLAACYCKMHETYRHISWRRLRTHHRSISCPDFESCNENVANGKHRLSVDAICEATSLAFDNGSMDTTNHHQHLTSPRI